MMPSTTSTARPIANTPERVYFVDWMRTIAIYLVVLVHAVISVWRVTPITDDMWSQKITLAKLALLQFGMPLFFYYSGRAASLNKDNFPRFLYKKFMRLMVPSALGYCFVVMPTAFIGRSYRPGLSVGQRALDNFWEFAASYLFSADMSIKRNGLEWLWFFPVLFVLAIGSFALHRWVKERYNDTEREGFSTADIVPISWILVSPALVLICAPALGIVSWQWSALAVLPYPLTIVTMAYIGKIRRSGNLYPVFFCNAIPTLLMAYYQNQWGSDYNDIVVSLLYYNLFFNEGFINQLFFEEFRQFRKTLLHRITRPFKLLLMILGLAICAPNITPVSNHYRYPLYMDSSYPMLRVLIVLGTWNYLMMILRFGQAFFNQKLSPFLYKHGNDSTIVVYTVHWLIMEAIQVYVVKAAGITSFGIALLIVFPPTILLSWGVYAIAVNVPYVGLVCGISPPRPPPPSVTPATTSTTSKELEMEPLFAIA